METVAAGMVVLVAIKLDVSEAAIVNIIVNGLDVTKYSSEMIDYVPGESYEQLIGGVRK